MKHALIDDRVKVPNLDPAPRLLHEFFALQAGLRPWQIAIECNSETATYSELDDFANRVAALLRSKGVGPGSLVAIYMAKSCRVFAAILGVLKAGAGYVPIDPKLPVARTRSILDDAAVAIVLSEEAIGKDLAPHVTSQIIYLDAKPDHNGHKYCDPVVVTPSDICYVIYTSGSTGRPKGVVIEHRNAVNFVRAIRQVYALNENDRVYQGFSIAFDASVEEIWGAFSVGATLVVPTEDVARSTLDAGDFINTHRLTFFSTVPSFLALMKPDLPTVKLLILGGEACPSELVSRWVRPGLRMLNTYGPTEATVVATAAECALDEPVTIGTALPGYATYVLNEKLTQVEPGECGELYIGGESVARGYMNRPELTAERFIRNPFGDQNATAPRLYRTFDLVRLAENGNLQFIGRADDQIKIRGFRVELSEIEAVLMEYPSVRLAAVNVVETGNLKDIAAFVLLNLEGEDLDRKAIGALLRSRLPEYMLPKYLDVLQELPTMTSGKTDRKMLPPPRTLFIETDQYIVLPETPLERAIAEAWERALHVTSVSIEHDFFIDLHGNSLVAGLIVTDLRERLGTVSISMRDCYRHRTIKLLAAHLDGIGVEVGEKSTDNEFNCGSSDSADESPSLPRTRWLCVSLQLLGLIAYYAALSAPAVFAIVIVYKVIGGEIEWFAAADIATLVSFAIWPSWLLLGIVLKWVVVGRYKAGRYPVWGFYYFRWWLVSRFQGLGWPEVFAGTPLMSLYYRAMGAKIGRNCTIGTELCVAFDLVSIGDDTSIGTDTHLLGYRIENGWLTLGNVTIGRECYVGTHSCLGLDVTMHDRARLDNMSLLADQSIMAVEEARRGSPAEEVEVELPSSRRRRPGNGTAFLYGMFHLALIYVMGYILILSAVPAIGLVSYALYAAGPLAGIVVAFASVPVSILWYLQVIVAVKKLVIGRILPGTISLYSGAYLRYWFLNYLLSITRQIVLPLYATLFLPRFWRQLGAKIGRMVEISTITHVMPDLLEVADGSFLADGCIVGGHRIYDGVIEIRPNKIGKHTFVGNSALIPAGVTLGDNSMIGVLSTPPGGVGRTPDGSSWLGSPGFELPDIQQVACFSARQTFYPSYFRICGRTLVDLLRVFLPGLVMMATLVVFCVAVIVSYRSFPIWGCLLLAPCFALVVSFGSLVCVAAFKYVLMGTFKPIVKPLWCSYVWLNEVVNALHETVAAAALLPLMGTPFISMYLRLMGCKIGRWVFLESTLFSEFDLVQIGDRAALNLGSTIQTHLFEDRIMKADSIKIGAGCSVGNMAVVLYSTEMQHGSSLGPLSVLMKGERLPANSRWYGIPSQTIESDVSHLFNKENMFKAA